LKQLSPEEKKKLVELLAEKKKRQKRNSLAHFKPYEWQKKLYKAGTEYTQRAAICANRIGKSYGVSAEVAMHATGLYPDWWEGDRYDHPVKIIVGGVTNESTRDVLQKELCGEPSDPDAWGTGAIPYTKIMDKERKAGIPNALSSVTVKHVSGGKSMIKFLAFEAGKERWMGTGVDLVWLDEEAPMDIYSQALRAIADRGGRIIMTFTPENGVTELYKHITQDTDTVFVMNATWDDAPHLTPEVREEILSSLPPFERDMRSKGIPVMGSGLIFPVKEDDIKVDPFEIPDHFARIAGIDMGMHHPTAWVACAYDADRDIIYVYDLHTARRQTPDTIAAALRHKGASAIPTAWPHDSLIQDKTSGRCLRDMYVEEGLYLLPDKFSNPPEAGKPEGSGGNGVEAGLMEMLRRMEQGRLKVFSNLSEWFVEFRHYHRKDGKVVKKNDDIMSATRYAVMSLRFAQPVNFKFEAFIPAEHADYYALDLVGY